MIAATFHAVGARSDGKFKALQDGAQSAVRIFNPFRSRWGVLRLGVEFIVRGSDLNHRMHNKSWIADGRVLAPFWGGCRQALADRIPTLDMFAILSAWASFFLPLAGRPSRQQPSNRFWLASPMRATNRAILLCLLVWLGGCAATAECPAVEDPRPAFVLEHGRHTTLVLSSADGQQLWRYGYGDWRFYAEAETGFWSGARALVIPSEAALGRRHYHVDEATATEVRRAVGAGIGEVYSFEVSGAAADGLREQLELQYLQGLEQKSLINEPYDFEFVHHPRRYWFWYNSNNRVADWLEELGCEVSGWTNLTLEAVD